ncbi:ribosomal RNA processing protein 1 homolog A-like isoform X2 [Mugil cephalus]|uniref:ribosomal RNA processing protein 1 homolog A-like isoform X2 n=1 Tax=Mugil cephalus TaxID=48193 RepID=UPI001FB7C402|nr:ribosomal RNA processing protein 1 homolog A-like isoform X2 [Mugil cephalus]
MALIQEPEIQFAQRLASNEKPTRTKALKKLRKYINVRSQKEADGFSSDELLKLWKGLFYCLWMQDKPLLQEDLSKQISNLIHSFHDTDRQLLYLESFLQTFKREWTGIDRLRMDKFYQLVRFMFRQTFEMLKRKNWDSSAVAKFLELLTAQLLHSSSAAPKGLQYHILDLYMTELAAVGSAELTAEQNLTFIEPFCKSAATTKDWTLFTSICSSVFSTIIDQAPFAIEDLMKELKATEASDLGLSSEEEDEEQGNGETKIKTLNGGGRGKKMNDKRSKREEDDDLDEDEDEDDDADCSEPEDEDVPSDDIGPVLQFDYAALADKLFKLSSRSSTPSHNRKRLYKIIKVLRDLSEGSFPQDEYQEEVSTDEDDDMFATRKRIKPGRGHDDEQGVSAGQTSKGKKKEKKQNENHEKSDTTVDGVKKVKKKKVQENAETVVQDAKGGPDCSQDFSPTEADIKTPGKKKKNRQKATSGLEGEMQVNGVSSDMDAASLVCENSAEDATTITLKNVTDAASPAKKKRKRKAKKKSLGGDGLPETTADQTEADIISTEINSEAAQHDVSEPLKKTTKKRGKQEVETDQTPEESTAADECLLTPLVKKRKKNLKQCKKAVEEAESPQVAEAEKVSEDTVATPAKKKKNKTKNATKLPTAKTNEIKSEDAGSTSTELPLDGRDVVPASGKAAKKKRKIPVVFEFEADELEGASVNGHAQVEDNPKKTKLVNDVGEISTPLKTKKAQKKAMSAQKSESSFITFQSKTAVPTPLFCKTKESPSTPLSGKKKVQTPKSESKKVTFGLRNNKTAESYYVNKKAQLGRNDRSAGTQLQSVQGTREDCSTAGGER